MEIKKYYNTIPAVIEDLKKEYGFANTIIREDIFGILEKYCVVVYYPLEEERNYGFHTTRFVKNEIKDFVYINTAKQLPTQVFTAAHELGHVWKVVEKIKNKLSDADTLSIKEEEDIIDRFAAELLMPYDIFKEVFFDNLREVCDGGQKIKFVDLILVAVMQMNDFMVPYEAVRRRLIETEILTANVGEDLKRDGVDDIVKAFSKEINTMLDQQTWKKTIPGLRSVINELERKNCADEYLLARIKKDFDIDELKEIDEIVDITVGEGNSGDA